MGSPHSQWILCTTVSYYLGVRSWVSGQGLGGGLCCRAVRCSLPHFGHLYIIIIMLPYRPPETKARPPQPQRLKPLPSLQFTNIMNLLCEGTQNTYDPKDHILTINDIDSFESSARNKIGRSLRSIEKQLRMLGFRLRKNPDNYDQNQQAGMAECRVYKWKGKKELLIEEQLNCLDRNLKQRKLQLEHAKLQVKSSRKLIDSEIESVILSLLVDSNSCKAQQKLDSIIGSTRALINQTEQSVRNILGRVSSTLGSELELYKLLIYKDSNVYKRGGNKVDELNNNTDNQKVVHSEQSDQDNREQEQSKKSEVSIEMDHAVREQMERQNNNQAGV